MAAGGSSAQMKPDGLVQSIKSKLPCFEIKCEDFKTPTSGLVVAYYTKVMEEFGVDFGQCYHLNDIEHIKKLYHIVAYLFSKLGIAYFSFDDIVNPGSKRTHKFFVIMDNFHTFADQQAQEVAKLKDKREAMLSLFQQLTKSKNELLEQENQRAVHRATRQEQGHQLQKHMEELKVAKAAAVEKKFQLSESSRLIEEKKLVVAKATVNKLIASVSEVDEELAKLERRIVTKTSEELQQEVSDVKSVMRSLEDDLKVQNNGLQQKMERVRSLEAELTELQDSNRKLEETWALLCKERELSSTLSSIQKETESVAASLKQTRQELQAKKKECAKLQKQHEKAKRDLAKKVSSFEDDLKKLDRKFADLRKSLEQKDVELSSVCEQTLLIAAKREEEIEAIKNEHMEYEEACKRYKLLVKSYAEGILKGLKNFGQSLEKFDV